MVLDKGKIMIDCPPLKIITKTEELRNLRIEVPQAVELVYELNKLGVKIPYKLQIEEVAEELWKLF